MYLKIVTNAKFFLKNLKFLTDLPAHVSLLRQTCAFYLIFCAFSYFELIYVTADADRTHSCLFDCI